LERVSSRQEQNIAAAGVTLTPGETRPVTFGLGPAVRPPIDRRRRRGLEPGRFDGMAGTSSITLTTATLDVVER